MSAGYDNSGAASLHLWKPCARAALKGHHMWQDGLAAWFFLAPNARLWQTQPSCTTFDKPQALKPSIALPPAGSRFASKSNPPVGRHLAFGSAGLCQFTQDIFPIWKSQAREMRMTPL